MFTSPANRISQLARDARREGGFTLIELVVVMVILVMVLAVVTRTLLDGYSATNDTISEAKAQHLVQMAADQMTQDMRSARADDRNFNDIRQPLRLKNHVLAGADIYSEDCPPSLPTCRELDVDDVRIATPTTFQILADVIPSAAGAVPRAECVTYTSATAAPTFWLRRNVTTFNKATVPGTCNAGGETTYLIPPQPWGGSGTSTSMFTYQQVCDRSEPSCLLGGANSLGCTPVEVATTTTARQRSLITGITLDLGAYVERLDSTATDSLRTKVGIRTRENHDYRMALGCG